MLSNVKKTGSALAVGLALAFAGNAAHAVVSYAENPLPGSDIPSLTGFSTTGAMMSGMSVNAIFSEGLDQTLSWATTGASSGGVTGAGWGLSLDGDSYGGIWQFSFSSVTAGLGSLTQLILNGNTGYTVFDRTYDGNWGTAGSAQGWDFVFSGTDYTATATYSDAVGIGGAAPVGDLFHKLTIDFTQGPTTSFAFIQDTDNDSRYGVPEPASLALLGLGLAGLAAIRRRKPV